MRVLITGGAGFIGGYVTERFVRAGHTVAVADKFSYAGKGKNVAAVLDRIDLLIGNLSTGDLAARCAAWEPDIVIHMAGDTHVDHAITDPFRFGHNNYMGTTALLEALRRMPTPPRRIVVYSTDEVFGPTPAGVAFDESAPFRPSNAYSASKVGVEALATAFHVTHGLNTVVVRPCNTYGPRQHPEKVIPKFVGQILAGEKVTLYNDGQGARDWLHATDHAAATELVAHLGEPGTSYNMAANDEHTDQDIYLRIVATLKAGDFHLALPTWPPLATYVPGRPGHDRRYMMDGSRLRALGWSPRVRFVDGFADTVVWNARHLRSHWADDVVRLTQPGDEATVYACG